MRKEKKDMHFGWKTVAAGQNIPTMSSALPPYRNEGVTNI